MSVLDVLWYVGVGGQHRRVRKHNRSSMWDSACHDVTVGGTCRTSLPPAVRRVPCAS